VSIVQLKYRHEYKHELRPADLLAIRPRLTAIMRPDPHAVGGTYRIRSLYFDTPRDKALREKLDGVNLREKFRIRCYNGNYDVIHLEKKSKRGGLGTKASAPLAAQEVRDILEGRLDWMMDSGRPLVQELYCKMRYQNLRPKTLVDYTREPFIYEPGNVRVTFDTDLRTALSCTDLLDPGCPTVPAGDAPILMEVKWDEYLPDIIRDAVWVPGRRASAFSKYAQCRFLFL